MFEAFVPMQLSEWEAQLWTQRLLAVALVQQSVEFLLMRRLGLSLGFKMMMGLRALLAVTLVFVGAAIHPYLLSLLVLIQLGYFLWFRGPFNGGSDSMTMVVLSATWMASVVNQPLFTRACLAYIAAQTCLSYLMAGLLKVRHPTWRNGSELAAYLRFSRYAIPAGIRCLAGQGFLMFAASWTVIIFEIVFPLALLNATLAWTMIAMALGFHMVNAQVLGLNRFIWAWLSAYPAILYCSGLLSG